VASRKIGLATFGKKRTTGSTFSERKNSQSLNSDQFLYACSNPLSLSSAEAELIAYSERCQAARFAQQLLGEILGKEQTAVVLEDNQGCIHLVKNQKTSTRTKHLDVRWLFCRDFYINGKILPVFVRTEENYADGCTKNQGEKLFAKHDSVLRGGIIPYRREDVEKALAMETSNTERGESAEQSEPAEFDRGRSLKRGTDGGTRGSYTIDKVRQNELDLSSETKRIATEGHIDDRDRSGISIVHEDGLGKEIGCSVKNKHIERGFQDQENSDRLQVTNRSQFGIGYTVG
jgi:hypothetical protein